MNYLLLPARLVHDNRAQSSQLASTWSPLIGHVAKCPSFDSFAGLEITRIYCSSLSRTSPILLETKTALCAMLCSEWSWPLFNVTLKSRHAIIEPRNPELAKLQCFIIRQLRIMKLKFASSYYIGLAGWQILRYFQKCLEHLRTVGEYRTGEFENPKICLV